MSKIDDNHRKKKVSIQQRRHMQTEAVIKIAKKALKFIRFPQWISAFNYLKPHQERDYHTRQPLLVIDFLF